MMNQRFKRVSRLFVSGSLLWLLIGCLSSEEAFVSSSDLISYMGKEFGEDVPEWFFLEDKEIPQIIEEYSEYVVFSLSSLPSRSLKGASLLLESHDVVKGIKLSVLERVETRVARIYPEKNSFVNAYIDSFSKEMNNRQFKEVSLLDSFWVLKKHRDFKGREKKLYTYYAVWGVRREVLKEVISDVLNDINIIPMTDEEKRSVYKIRTALLKEF